MNDPLIDPPSEPSNFYEALVGENKKFKDNESLAKAKWNSDSYVKVLESRSDLQRDRISQLEQELKDRTNLEDLVNHIKATPASSEQPKANVEPEKPQLDIDSLVEKKVAALAAAGKAQQNWDQVKTKIKERYGDNVPDSVRTQIESLGEIGAQLARSNPDAFLKAIGVSAEQAPRQTFQAPPNRTVRTDTFTPKGPVEKTWAYWQDQFKKDPSLHHNKRVAVEMHNAAIELGERFFDGDAQASDQELLNRIAR